VLLTSRELLRIQGEVEHPVLPLADSEAVSLFCTRSALEPSDEVAELCRRLDCLPLALELAAARSGVLSPAQTLERLSQRLDLLRGGRGTEARQQTLRATIEWSHDLLGPDEKTLFAGLANFAGGWTLDAAEAVTSADLETLQALVQKSLVRHSGERFSMLETIHEYARERLEESGQAEAIRRRHAEFFLALAESAGLSVEGLGAGRGSGGYGVVIPEQANIRAALEFLLVEGEI
jgi:predicted ATPase